MIALGSEVIPFRDPMDGLQLVPPLENSALHQLQNPGYQTDQPWPAVVSNPFSMILYSLPFWPLRFFFLWDITLFICWLTVFAIFASLYMHEDPEGNHDIEQMRDAMWLDLVNWLLWLVSSVVGGWYFWKYRNQKTSLSGRARENTKFGV
ncbi:hypothetical protein TWF481_004829 [Arthrobotrys musiformis]|uniref:Uncharacterized protein n=1 Tax=Arthrobotrys musiformis TaxID=47236 RepID=A0AAV9WKQ1_9PEZI